MIEIYFWQKAKRPAFVCPPAPVLLRQEEPSCTRLYTAEPHVAARRYLSWGEFKKFAKRAGLPKNISWHSCRLLNTSQADVINSMWKK